MRQRHWELGGRSIQREQKEVYQVRQPSHSTSEAIYILMTTKAVHAAIRLRHATTAQDDLSESLASSFVRSTSSEPTPASSKEVDDFVKELRELRKTYHKRGNQWTIGQGRLAWRTMTLT